MQADLDARAFSSAFLAWLRLPRTLWLVVGHLLDWALRSLTVLYLYLTFDGRTDLV
jgi:hypothetical protein